jgi:hypothetical protein
MLAAAHPSVLLVTSLDIRCFGAASGAGRVTSGTPSSPLPPPPALLLPPGTPPGLLLLLLLLLLTSPARSLVLKLLARVTGVTLLVTGVTPAAGGCMTDTCGQHTHTLE